MRGHVVILQVGYVNFILYVEAKIGIIEISSVWHWVKRKRRKQVRAKADAVFLKEKAVHIRPTFRYTSLRNVSHILTTITLGHVQKSILLFLQVHFKHRL